MTRLLARLAQITIIDGDFYNDDEGRRATDAEIVAMARLMRPILAKRIKQQPKSCWTQWRQRALTAAFVCYGGVGLGALVRGTVDAYHGNAWLLWVGVALAIAALALNVIDVLTLPDAKAP